MYDRAFTRAGHNRLCLAVQKWRMSFTIFIDQAERVIAGAEYFQQLIGNDMPEIRSVAGTGNRLAQFQQQIIFFAFAFLIGQLVDAVSMFQEKSVGSKMAIQAGFQ